MVQNGEMMVKINHNITRIFFVSQSNEKIAVHCKHWSTIKKKTLSIYSKVNILNAN